MFGQYDVGSVLVLSFSNHNDHLLVSSWDKIFRLYNTTTNVLRGFWLGDLVAWRLAWRLYDATYVGIQSMRELWVGGDCSIRRPMSTVNVIDMVLDACEKWWESNSLMCRY
ncbi:hypothetical protein ACLB2K_064781 [Fragaria x ananassa]